MSAVTDLGHARGGQVWTAPDGRPMIYVRTEQRNGCDVPEHLFISARDRIVLERWHPDGVPFPERLELRLDPEASWRAESLEGEVVRLTRENETHVRVVRAAFAMLPEERREELRNIWREGMRT